MCHGGCWMGEGINSAFFSAHVFGCEGGCKNWLCVCDDLPQNLRLFPNGLDITLSPFGVRLLTLCSVLRESEPKTLYFCQVDNNFAVNTCDTTVQ